MCSEGYSTLVCVCVCVCIRSNLPSHTLESQKRDTNRLFAIREQLKKAIFEKYFVEKLWQNLLTSSTSGGLLLFFPRKKLLYQF